VTGFKAAQASKVIGELVACEPVTAVVPSSIVGYTADFEIACTGSCTLFVDNRVIGSSSSVAGTDASFSFSAELYAGSVIAVEAWQTRGVGATAIKLRYRIDGSTHTLDAYVCAKLPLHAFNPS
jgi:hypothetical protein